MILRYEIDEMISNMTASGIDPIKEDYVIYTSPTVRFSEGVYQLEIIVNDKLPDGIVCIARRKNSDRKDRVRQEWVQDCYSPDERVLQRTDDSDGKVL